MKLAKKRHKPRATVDVITARMPTIGAVVASPFTPGTVDRVDRVLDSVLALRRAGRITAEQYQAAEVYRGIYDTVRSGPGGSLDPSKMGGAGFGSRTPAIHIFDAALRLREATRALNAIRVPSGGVVGVAVVVEMVAGQGWTIDSAACAIHGQGADGRASGRHRVLVATMFRSGLDALVEMWFRSAPQRTRKRAC